MHIGKKIKALRLQKGLTQEKLAALLNVTPQAVSKWENETALPDITLLPALSVCFGVRIDDFFALSDAGRLERIDNMLEREEFLPREDLDNARHFLEERIAADPADARALRTLAALYNHRADGYHRKAEMLAKRSLEIDPTEKEGHSLLSFAAAGACWDWCSANHRQLIDYYYDFIAKNPTYRQGYLWLLDNLIADGRLDEADKATDDMAKVEHTYHVPLYKGHIAFRRGDAAAAEVCWQQMLDTWPEKWIVWSVMGDARVKQCRYKQALEMYRKAASLETRPRFIDNWDSIGQICEMLGDSQAAADAYEQVLAIYRDDWQISEGYLVEKYRAAILACRAK